MYRAEDARTFACAGTPSDVTNVNDNDGSLNDQGFRAHPRDSAGSTRSPSPRRSATSSASPDPEAVRVHRAVPPRQSVRGHRPPRSDLKTRTALPTLGPVRGLDERLQAPA